MDGLMWTVRVKMKVTRTMKKIKSLVRGFFLWRLSTRASRALIRAAISRAPFFMGLKKHPISKPPHLKSRSMSHDVQEGDVTRREELVAPAFAIGVWECLMKTRAELELIESSSDQESDREGDY
jgi:hypothetical protein